MRLYWSRLSLQCNLTDRLKTGNLDTDVNAEKMAGEVEGRNLQVKENRRSQATPKTWREKHKPDSPSRTTEEAYLAQTLILEL